MKFYIRSLFLSVILFSCSNSTDNKTRILNTVSLQSDNLEFYSEQDINLDITFKLAYPAVETTEFRLTLEDKNKTLKLKNESVTLQKGTTSVVANISIEQLESINRVEYIYLALEDLFSQYRLAEPLKITLRPNISIKLSDKQKELIKGYKKKYGVDIMQLLGDVHCSGTVNQPWINEGVTYFAQPQSYTINGNTILTLSEQSTEDMPVLKFITNPMGLSKIYADIFNSMTILDRENWIYDANPSLTQPRVDIAKAIDWTPLSNRNESFDMTLDGVTLDLKNNTVNFIKPLSSISDSIPSYMLESIYDLELKVVPFVFHSSVWNKLDHQSNIQEGLKSKLAQNSICPYQILYASDITDDMWENTPTDFIQPNASVDFKEGTLRFNFCFDFSESAGYNQVNVTCRKKQ